MSDTLPTDDRQLAAAYRAGDEAAARQLFDKYCERLLRLAGSRISQKLASRVDPQDVVQSAFRTFFARTRNDEFVFEGQDDLFKLLVRITVHKTLRQIAHHRAKRRSVAAETGHGDAAHEQLMQLAASQPTPDVQVAVMESLERFVAQLAPADAQVLELKIQGHTTAEIAVLTGSYDRKVRRVLERIRGLAEAPDGPFASAGDGVSDRRPETA